MHWFTESNFSKLFNMSQMTIEYLLYVQEHLHGRNVSLEALLTESEQHAAAIEERLREQAEYVGALEQQLRNTRAGIAGTDGRPTETCPSCKKSFLNIDYLHAHMRRRHPTTPLPPASAPAPATPAPALAMVDNWGGAAFASPPGTAPPAMGAAPPMDTALVAEAVQAAVGAAMHAVKGEAAAELQQSLQAHLSAELRGTQLLR